MVILCYVLLSRTWLTNELHSLSRQSAHCEEQLFSWNRQLHLLQKFHAVVKDLLRLLYYDENISSNSLESFMQLAKSHYNDVSNQLASIIPSIKQLYQRVVRDENLVKEWTAACRTFSALNGVCGKSATYVIRLKDSWQHLLRDRAARGSI